MLTPPLSNHEKSPALETKLTEDSFEASNLAIDMLQLLHE